MKMTSVLVALALVLAIIGAGISYTGYSESLRSHTLTSVHSFTVTSATTVASTSTESIVMTTSSTNWILQEEVFDLPHPPQGGYCGHWSSMEATLDAGEVHVSYFTDGRPVQFWMLTSGDYAKWEHAKYCQDLWAINGMAHKSGTNAEDLTVSAPSDGEYYFVFMNTNAYDAIVVTLNVDAGIQQTEYTITSERTTYSTQQTMYPTQTVTFSTEPVGLGVLFYLGIALIVVAVVVLAMGMRRGVSPSPAPAPPATSFGPSAPAISPASVTGARKFCVNCGAPLPTQVTYCNKCGSKQ